MSTARNFDEITEGLGEHFEISLNTYKPFACGIVIHPSIDGCVQLRNENGLKADDVASIELEVHPLVLELTGKKTPRTGLEGKFSVYHSCAVAIIHGAAGEPEYDDDVVADPAVIALRDRIGASASSGIREDEVRIRLTTRDGKVIEKHVTHAIGSLERPMSDADLEAKFKGLVEPVLGAAGAAKLIELCWTLQSLSDVATIARSGANPAGNKQAKAV
jgi:2-methylcitrate dehydratase PrpD